MRECKICGKLYKYCPDCERIGSWKAVADNVVCYSIYIIMIEYRDGIICSDKAVEKLNNIGITKDKVAELDVTDSIRKMINKIFSESIENAVKQYVETKSEIKDKDEIDDIQVKSFKKSNKK